MRPASHLWQVPPSDALDGCSAEFAPLESGHVTCVLQLQRAFAAADFEFRSVHFGTNHWAAALPLPSL